MTQRKSVVVTNMTDDEKAELAAVEQVDRWFARHAELNTYYKSDAYATIAYRRADHEEALKIDAEQYGPEATARAAGRREAMQEMRQVVKDWVKTKQENHEALGHRGEGEDCWTRWHTEDIFNMIDDAARGVGVYGLTDSH